MAPGVSRHSTCATGGQQSKAAFARQQAGPYNSAVRDWDLTSGEPLSLCIAADARLCQPNYGDDQSWELRLEGGEPASLAVETTYGLRARGMRIFPAFQIGEQRGAVSGGEGEVHGSRLTVRIALRIVEIGVPVDEQKAVAAAPLQRQGGAEQGTRSAKSDQ